jgi:hypothetical protein
MKKIISVAMFFTIMLVFVVGSSYTNYALQKPSIHPVQAETPTPQGQISLPEVKIQLFVPGPNPAMNTSDSQNRLSGFVTGLFHGLISPGTLLVSFFDAKVQMYEVHNNGALYNLGFLLGAAFIFIVLGITTRRRRI